MKGHTGAVLSMGKGAVISGLMKQKLVTHSSTECEVVGAHDTLPQALWVNLFLKVQGHRIKDTLFYPDNLSMMLLEKNGQMSSTKQTKHMETQFFYIKDCITSSDIMVEYCPTGNMLGDFFSKPQQGTLFQQMQDRVMNIDPSSP